MNSMDQTSNFFIIMEKHKQSKGDIDSDKLKKTGKDWNENDESFWIR